MIEIPMAALAGAILTGVWGIMLAAASIRRMHRARLGTDAATLRWIVRARAVCLHLVDIDSRSDGPPKDGLHHDCPLSLVEVRPHGANYLTEVDDLHNHPAWTDPSVETTTIIAEVIGNRKKKGVA